MPVGTRLRDAVHIFDGHAHVVGSAGREGLADRIEGLAFLDPVANLLQRAARAAIPQGSAAKDALSGTWLGHPLHPPLTDVVVGTWTSASLLDAVGERGRAASKVLLGTGIAAALPTAASGLSDWAELRGGTRRVGLVHALGNTTALALQILSLRARLRGERAKGVCLSTLALTVAGGSAWLGGHLSFGRGVGVDQTAFEDFPETWTAVADAARLGEEPLRGTAGETGVVLVRSGERIHALADHCSHRGCSLAEGTLRDEAIVCACHGSMFALDGSVLHGPATAPQPSLEVRVREGKVEVRRRPDRG